MEGANDGAAAEMDAAEEGQVLKGDLAAFARLSNEQQRQLHTLDLSRTAQQQKANNPQFGAEGAASLAPALQHLKLLQSLNLEGKQQGSGGCVQRVGLGRRVVFGRWSYGCVVQCWGVGCWSMMCVCWVW